jgi:hypothetical protein
MAEVMATKVKTLTTRKKMVECSSFLLQQAVGGVEDGEVGVNVQILGVNQFYQMNWLSGIVSSVRNRLPLPLCKTIRQVMVCRMTSR